MPKFGVDIAPTGLTTTTPNWGLHNNISLYSAPSTNQTELLNISSGAGSGLYLRKISGNTSDQPGGRNTTVGDFPALVRSQSQSAGGTVVYKIAGAQPSFVADSLQFAFARSSTTDGLAAVTLSNGQGYTSSTVVADAELDTSGSIASFTSPQFSSTGELTITVALNTGSTFIYPTAIVLEYTEPLVISGVSGSATLGGTITATVTGGGSAGSATLSYGSYSETMTNGTWGASSIQLTRPDITSAHLFPGMVATLTITNSIAESDTFDVTIPAIDSRSVVTLEELGGIDWINLESGSLAIGDGLVYTPVLYSGGSPTEYTFTIAVDGSFSVDETAPDGTYTVLLRVWDATDGNYGDEETQTILLGGTADIDVPSGTVSLSGQTPSVISVTQIIDIPTDTIMNIQGERITYTYPHWFVTDTVDIDVAHKLGSSINIIDSGTDFVVVSGGGSRVISGEDIGQNYTLVLFSNESDNLKTHYVRLNVVTEG